MLIVVNRTLNTVHNECDVSKKKMNFILRKCKASADYNRPEWHLISSNIFVQAILLVVGLVLYKLLGQDCCGLPLINKKRTVAGKYDTAWMDLSNSQLSHKATYTDQIFVGTSTLRAVNVTIKNS